MNVSIRRERRGIRLGALGLTQTNPGLSSGWATPFTRTMAVQNLDDGRYIDGREWTQATRVVPREMIIESVLRRQVMKLKTEMFRIRQYTCCQNKTATKVKKLMMTRASHTCFSSSASLYAKQLILLVRSLRLQ